MIKQSFQVRVAALAAAVALTMPLGPVAAKVKAGSQVFEGLLEHVSSSNIKVVDPKSHQTLGFLLVPRFNKVFKSHGRTMQQALLKEGQYVKVYYDQKALGARHADRILILNNSNMAMRKLKS